MNCPWLMSKPGISCAMALFVGALLLCDAGCSDQSEGSSSAQNPPMVIDPHISVGKVRAAMTVDQVIAELGKPERRTATALEYSRLGLAVLPGSNGPVQVVMCGDVTGINGPFVKAFTGRTKEGIGMNSTRDEVIKAYGEPTSSEKFIGGIESLQYAPLGLTLTLEGSKVHHMIVRLQNQELDRTVNLPSPEQK